MSDCFPQENRFPLSCFFSPLHATQMPKEAKLQGQSRKKDRKCLRSSQLLLDSDSHQPRPTYPVARHGGSCSSTAPKEGGPRHSISALEPFRPQGGNGARECIWAIPAPLTWPLRRSHCPAREAASWFLLLHSGRPPSALPSHLLPPKHQRERCDPTMPSSGSSRSSSAPAAWLHSLPTPRA